MDILEKNNTIKKVYIKLGTNCNLNCKYCHSEKKYIKYNSDILPILKSMNLKQISFGGGEPLLYWDIIKEIVEYIGNNLIYSIVTNGTLFTKEIVNFCNKNNISIGISIDGINSTRDKSIPIQWELISKLNRSSVSIVIYNENKDIETTLDSLNYYKEKYLTKIPNKFSSFPNFIHSTKNTGKISSYELAESYVKQMTNLLEETIVEYKENDNISVFLYLSFINFYKHKDFNGIKCCNSKSIPILANGDICICPYTLDKVGDIFNLEHLDFNKLEKDNMRPECYKCNIFDICHNYCCKNITDHECYIMKSMHNNIKILLNKYNISYEELNSRIR